MFAQQPPKSARREPLRSTIEVPSQREPSIQPVREAAPGASWDFSKIATFSTDRVGRPPASYWSSLPGLAHPRSVGDDVRRPTEHEADRVRGRAPLTPPGVGAGFHPTTIERPRPAEISRQINRPHSVTTSPSRLERGASVHDLSDAAVHQDAANLSKATATPNTAEFSPRLPVIQRGAANHTAAAASDASESRTAASPSIDAAVPGLIVEDDAAQVGLGQMKKSSFLSQLRIEVRGAADAILAASGRSTKGCPYLKFWLDYYSRRDGRHIEQAIRRYAPGAARVGTARDYIGFVVDRVIRAVTLWTAAGEATGESATLPAAMPLAASIGAAAPPETGGPQHGERKGGATTGALQAIQSQLGTGTALDAGVRSRMESAFGYDFSRVRIHANERMAGNLNSRAFAIGNDIAFGVGEYAPGTLSAMR